MAKVTLGPTIAAASGSIGGTVYSRNRYGTYIRTRAIPVNPNTSHQQKIRGILAARSQEWRDLDDDTRNQWVTWAAINPFTDVLGNSQVLQPNAAFVRLNMLLTHVGDEVIESPPVGAAPDALTSFSFVASKTLESCVLTYEPTPLDGDDHLVIYAAVVNSAGVKYVENLYKMVEISAVATPSGISPIVAIENRFGDLIVGQTVHIRLRVLDSLTGLISPPITASDVVV